MGNRSGVLELAVLGLLHEAPMHGYELRKRVNAQFGWGRVLSFGSLYPCLKAMLRNGLISADAGTPDGRRQKIVYTITADGKDHFAHAMHDAGPSAWLPTKRRTTASSASRPTIDPWTGFTPVASARWRHGPAVSASGETLSQRPALGISYRARVRRPETQLNIVAAVRPAGTRADGGCRSALFQKTAVHMLHLCALTETRPRMPATRQPRR